MSELKNTFLLVVFVLFLSTETYSQQNLTTQYKSIKVDKLLDSLVIKSN